MLCASAPLSIQNIRSAAAAAIVAAVFPSSQQVGSWYNTFQSEYTAQTGLAWAPGTNTGRYPNTQRSTTLWYHDHT